MTPFSETFPSGANGARASGRRPTMREVAAVAGVSLSTVSRAINDDPKVDPDLAAKVRDAVAMLGYRRDVTATTLRRADRLSASIGLVFDDVANPFHATLHRGIEDVARGRGGRALAGSSEEAGAGCPSRSARTRTASASPTSSTRSWRGASTGS